MTRLNLDTRELAESYDRLSDSQFLFGKLLIERMGVRAGERVLDVGCGTGRLAEYVSQVVGPTGTVLGIDPLPHRIEIALRRAKPGLGFAVGGSDDLGRFADAAWDQVCLNSVFHWIERKAEALEEIHRILRPGGKLGIGTGEKDQPNPFRKVIEGAIISVMGTVPEGTRLSPFLLSAEEWRNLVSEAGFSVRLVESQLYTDFVEKAEDLIEFLRSSSFGNFLAGIPEEDQPAILEQIRERLERLRTARGIERKFQRLLVVAERKA